MFVFHFAASTEYWQSHLFEKLTEEKRNVHLEVFSCRLFSSHFCMVLPTISAEPFWLQVTRGGRRVKISNYDIVVGDIVPLGNGGQVSITTFNSNHYLELHNWSEL